MALFGKRETNALKEEIAELQKKLLPENNDLERIQREIAEATAKKEALQKEIADTQNQLDSVKADYVETSDAVLFQSFGLYSPRFAFAKADDYKARLLEIRADQKEMIRNKTAVVGSTTWTVNGNAAQGKKMVSDMQKLLLRAFNSECDDIIGHVTYSNIEASEKRIAASKDAISKLGSLMSVGITNGYYRLKLDELYLAFEYAQKKQEEKEAQKEARAQLREAAKLAKEVEAARAKLEKEQTHYKNALAKVEAQLASASDADRASIEAKKQELEQQLVKIDSSFADLDYREANQKAGYVYIISNIGAFGEDVYKIGMTRRLEPMDRIDELGDASVPFDFDVHALIFSNDAPKLEAALHSAFADRKLNFVNLRREFFRVSLDEIKQVVRDNFDESVEFVDIAPADQYRQSLLLRGN